MGLLINEGSEDLATQAEILMDGCYLAATNPDRIDCHYLMRLELELSGEHFTLSKRLVSLNNFCLLNCDFRFAAGELFNALADESGKKWGSIWQTFIASCCESKLALMIDARDLDDNYDAENSDQHIAQAIKNLQSILEPRLTESDKQNYRIAVMFSCFDQPELWQYRDKPDAFARSRFPQAQAALHKWSTNWGCAIAYFSLSSFGMIDGSERPNTNRNDTRLTTLIDPDRWEPFGLIEPIYWLLLGEHMGQR
jgi:hypothetical protein